MSFMKCFLPTCSVLRDPELGAEWGSYCSVHCQSIGENKAGAQMSSLAWGLDTSSSDIAGPNSHRYKIFAPDSFDGGSQQSEG